MRSSDQDRHYLDVEADAFYQRNHAASDATVLRSGKRQIFDAIAAAGVVPKRIVEFGCQYGDLLDHYARELGAECIGIEPSKRAVERGLESYQGRVRLLQGTMAENAINADSAQTGRFDLVVVDDVFCWVSRETLYHSVANVDDLIGEGGFLFIREFAPLEHRRNRNHHVEDQEVWCYKPAAGHSALFVASGVYQVVWQRTWIDHSDGWVAEQEHSAFESRWCDSVLRKSTSDYYAT